MSINIKALNIKLNPEITDFLNKRLESMLRIIDFKSDNVTAYVQIGKISKHHQTGDFFKAEIDVKFSGRHIHAEAESNDLYNAIDLMKDELSGEIKSTKERKLSIIKRGARKLKNILRFNRDE